LAWACSAWSSACPSRSRSCGPSARRDPHGRALPLGAEGGIEFEPYVRAVGRPGVGLERRQGDRRHVERPERLAGRDRRGRDRLTDPDRESEDRPRRELRRSEYVVVDRAGDARDERVQRLGIGDSDQVRRCPRTLAGAPGSVPRVDPGVDPKAKRPAARSRKPHSHAMARARIELATPRFSVVCSTN
jgi:hypothetical protein